MKFFTLLLAFTLTLICNGQIQFSTTKHDFGDLNMVSERFVDIKLTNKSPKKGYILTIKKPAEVVYIITGKFMDMDSSQTIRFQVNPTKKGRFSYEIAVFTSDKDVETIIKLVGNLKEFSTETASYMQACPDFNTKSKNTSDFELTVVTIDKQTKALLSESSITMIQNGRPTTPFKTNAKGMFSRKSPLGFTYFYATHEGYNPAEMGAYVNFQRNTIVIELEKNQTLAQNPTPPPATKETPSTTETTAEITLDQELEKEKPTPIAESVPTTFNQLDQDNFDISLFKPINIVFILDVSASMKAGEKLELMKYSMYKFVEILRPQDQVSIVTYSSNASVLMDMTTGDQKEEIKQKIEKLKAEGFTAGGEGIKLGYKENLKHYLADGTNQIVIITDGAFNRNTGDYKKIIKKYNKKGVNMTVVGIQNSEKDKANMEEVAQLGGGRYVPILKLADAQHNLKQEMRFICFRK